MVRAAVTGCGRYRLIPECRSVQLLIEALMAKIAWNPQHPERICWGCPRYCAADDLACGNGTIRTPHPVELFGEDWLDWSNRRTGPGRLQRPPAPD